MVATSELSNVHFMECIYIGVFFMSLNSMYIYTPEVYIYIYMYNYIKMHLYTHKALLSSCMDEPHGVRGGRWEWSCCCAKHSAASRRSGTPKQKQE